MCDQGNKRRVWVKIPADLSCTGLEHWRDVPIDGCIASLVEALQLGWIDMRGSCCGHGKTVGDIHLQDGRVLLVLSPELGERYMAADMGARAALVADAIRGNVFNALP